jgi:hypothetical protein
MEENDYFERAKMDGKDERDMDITQVTKTALGKIEDDFAEALRECTTEEEGYALVMLIAKGMEGVIEKAIDRGVTNVEFGSE